MNLQKLSTINPVEYNNIDLAKFICAILIVLIHTSPFKDCSGNVAFYTSEVLARGAVPLFFAISGFLFFRKIIWENDKIKRCPANFHRLLHYSKHLFIIYLLWSCIYILASIPKWYLSGWWGTYVLKILS